MSIHLGAEGSSKSGVACMHCCAFRCEATRWGAALWDGFGGVRKAPVCCVACGAMKGARARCQINNSLVPGVRWQCAG